MVREQEQGTTPFCLSLAAKSASAYDELRSSNVLTLPTRRTLRVYKNAVKPGSGFNHQVIDELTKITSGLHGCQRYVVLSFDEMKIKEHLVYDKYSGQLVGYVDLGDPETNYASFKDPDSLATHGLVFYIRGFVISMKEFARKKILYMEELALLSPYLVLAERMGSFLMQFAAQRVENVNIIYNGSVAKKNTKLITDNFMVGLFRPTLENGVNQVNAPFLIKESGITINETTSNATAKGFTNLITANVGTGNGMSSISGTVFDKNEIRIVDVNGYEIESKPEKHLLILFCKDKPGLIGHIGTVVGKRDTNIAHMTFLRKEVSGDSIAVLSVDATIPSEIIEEVEKLDGITSANIINF